MSDIESQFATAVEDSTALAEKPDNDTLLELYGLYKQAKLGDVQGERPSSMDFVGAAKHDAWAELEGVSCEEAMQRYVALIARLKPDSA